MEVHACSFCVCYVTFDKIMLLYSCIYTFYLILQILYTISVSHGDAHVGSAGRGGTAGGGHPCIFQLYQLAPSQADSVGHVFV